MQAHADKSKQMDAKAIKRKQSRSKQMQANGTKSKQMQTNAMHMQARASKCKQKHTKVSNLQANVSTIKQIGLLLLVFAYICLAFPVSLIFVHRNFDDLMMHEPVIVHWRRYFYEKSMRNL